MRATDRRVSIANEVSGRAYSAVGKSIQVLPFLDKVLSIIRYIKLMALEQAYERRILEARDAELRLLRKGAILRILTNSLSTLGPAFALVAAFTSFTRIEHRLLTPSTAFSSIIIMNQIRHAINVRSKLS